MKWLHHLLKGASLTTALVVFQACYGVPQDPLYEAEGTAPMSFTVVSSESGEPLWGVRIEGMRDKYEGDYQVLGMTDAQGKCKVSIPYLRNQTGPYLRFWYGHVWKDTTLADLRERDIMIKMTPAE